LDDTIPQHWYKRVSYWIFVMAIGHIGHGDGADNNGTCSVKPKLKFSMWSGTKFPLRKRICSSITR
jgi:hypothetical protein